MANAAPFAQKKKELAELKEKLQSFQQLADKKLASGVDGGGAETDASRTVTTQHFNRVSILGITLAALWTSAIVGSSIAVVILVSVALFMMQEKNESQIGNSSVFRHCVCLAVYPIVARSLIAQLTSVVSMEMSLEMAAFSTFISFLVAIALQVMQGKNQRQKPNTLTFLRCVCLALYPIAARSLVGHFTGIAIMQAAVFGILMYGIVAAPQKFPCPF